MFQYNNYYSVLNISLMFDPILITSHSINKC